MKDKRRHKRRENRRQTKRRENGKMDTGDVKEADERDAGGRRSDESAARGAHKRQTSETQATNKRRGG